MDPVAEALARRVTRDRYPDAQAVFWGGSLVRGDGTETSDLDLVVINARMDHAFRETFLSEGRICEVFVHDPQSLEVFFAKEAARGRPAIIRVISESISLREGPVADSIRRLAEEWLAAGPAEWTQARAEISRYGAGDMLDDLRGATDAAEIRAVGAGLYAHAFEHLRRSQGRWNAVGKHIVRVLRTEEGALGKAYLAAFAALFVDADPRAAIDVVEAVYAPAGGVLTQWRQDAPPHRSDG